MTEQIITNRILSRGFKRVINTSTNLYFTHEVSKKQLRVSSNLEYIAFIKPDGFVYKEIELDKSFENEIDNFLKNDNI
jgi:hypothetical protein